MSRLLALHPWLQRLRALFRCRGKAGMVRRPRSSRPRLLLELLEDRATPSAAIASVPYVINAPGVYVLAGDLFYRAASGNAITVNASNVVIDFAEHTLWSAAGATATAAGIAANGQSIITIANGTIQGFLYGVRLAGVTSSGNQVRNMVLTNSSYIGLWVEGTASILANNVIASTGGCAIPGYTIPIGMHVAGPGSVITGNRVSNMIWYQGVTQEMLALAIDDAPNVSITYNAFSQPQLADSTWGIWLNSWNDDGSTWADLESNSFTNFAVGCHFDYAQGQAASNRFFNVPTMWSASDAAAVTDLGGNQEYSLAQAPGTVQSTVQPTFTWTPATGNASYELYIQDLNSKAILTIPKLPPDATSYTLTAAQGLPYGHRFIWWVGDVAADGKIVWSNGVNFSTALPPPPTAVAPGTRQFTNEPTFQWKPPATSTAPPASYELWIQDLNTQAIVIVPNLAAASTSYTLNASQSLRYGDRFAWWVGGVGADGHTISWGPGMNFAIAPLARPTAITPNTRLGAAQPAFTWSAGGASAAPATGYELWIQNLRTGTVLIVPSLPISSTSYTLTASQALAKGFGYVWWVGAVGADGKFIAWGSGLVFSI